MYIIRDLILCSKLVFAFLWRNITIHQYIIIYIMMYWCSHAWSHIYIYIRDQAGRTGISNYKKMPTLKKNKCEDIFDLKLQGISNERPVPKCFSTIIISKKSQKSTAEVPKNVGTMANRMLYFCAYLVQDTHISWPAAVPTDGLVLEWTCSLCGNLLRTLTAILQMYYSKLLLESGFFSFYLFARDGRWTQAGIVCSLTCLIR